MAHIEGGRPHPRTMGVTEEGEPFKMFGTQQLKFIDPAKPALGVKQIDVGKSFRQLTTSLGFDFGTPTTPNVFTTTRPQTTNGNGNGTCTTCDSDKCEECNAWDVPCELGHMFAGTCTPPPTNGNGEDCGWFGEKCWGKDNGEDCGWFGEKCWFKPPNLLWVKIILAVIGIGVLLWLLKPLFNMITATKRASSFKSISQSYGAV